MTLQPSRVVEQMKGIPFFVGKSSSNCSVCGKPLTAHESVARGIGPVCVRKHMGPGAHPSGSAQSAHAGGRARRKGKPTLAESYRGGIQSIVSLSSQEKGIESSHVVTYKDGSKALWKENEYGSAESELIAYEFSESIGWGIVPETVLPKGVKDVSTQRWVEGETALEVWKLERTILESYEGYLRDLPRKDPRMLVMDVLLGNGDRHRNNILIDKTGKQWAIDNNRAFSPSRPEGKLSYRHYGPATQFGLKVLRADVLKAAKDVRRWFRTPAYHKYLAKLEGTHGKKVARQFELNVADLAIWSRRAKVME